jgi:hypothetical protein
MNLKNIFSKLTLSTILFIMMNFGMARSSFSANVKSGIGHKDTTRTELTVVKPQETNTYGKLSGSAVAGFVCSIIGLALIASLSFFFLGILSSIAGVILSAIGLSQTSKGQQGKGFAIAGLILGILGVAIATGIISYFILYW